ncbi:Extracellular nuclease [Spironucleus salmonicida]|uniref:Extracellular nuclease n=1 Tax=Spironucleus salmonicida TaxID=348837 RepID=V6LAF1_9EUKA|nr:Extracellular nuclease [Spironucleus salmonicida]|eukprot:EST41387.1 Extracellular nuclease [Spironucleus salmonicida]
MMILVLQEYFPGSTGATLREQLNKIASVGYKQLGYNRGREELYGYVMNDPKENALYGCYTGLKMPCKYDQMDTSCNKAGDLNCEHTVPQSFFDKKEPMKGDLYHLRPAWSKSNGARSNYPFSYVEASEVKAYYGNDYQINTARPVDLENWSTLSTKHTFEPRDAQKGDSARAVAYFYTKYPAEFHSLGQTFSRVDDMIEWDLLFAPTELQLQQAQRIQEVQGNINPFMLEHGLVFRAYCDLSEGKYPCE